MKDIEEQIREDAKDGARVFALAQKEPFPFNENLRMVELRGRSDIRMLGDFGKTVGMSSFDVRRWYANGPTCEDRPHVLATYHPVIHKREGAWAQIIETAIDLAKTLNRWVWVTLGEDYWARILLGPDPSIAADEGDETRTGPLYNAAGEYQNDQYITAFSPTGEEHFIGCS